MANRYISLSLAGDIYDYIYNPETREVFTQDFPDVPVVRVHLGCGHSINHDDLRQVIENKIKAYEILAESF